MAKADLKHYQDSAGHVFSLSESDARTLGYTTQVEIAALKDRTPAAAPGASAELRELREQVRALQAQVAQLSSGAASRPATDQPSAPTRPAGR